MPHGRIVNVVDREVGSRLDGDHATGVTVLLVNDVFEFNEADDDSGDIIGSLVIGRKPTSTSRRTTTSRRSRWQRPPPRTTRTWTGCTWRQRRRRSTPPSSSTAAV